MNNIDDLIRQRLNKLRSESQIPAAAPSSALPPPKKSSVEEVEFLLQQLSAQTELEEKSMNERLDIDSQILQRLERLKAESGGLVGARIPSASSLTSAAAAARLEPSDDLPPPPMSLDDLGSDSDAGECVMCDATPSISCGGCFNDLYCQKCFSECHDPGENHQAKPYVARRKK
uniref:Zinc finger FYVE domain-containing protein 19 n=2 Tax=Lygus hesperus TaxID=30085 RepID=A0A0K8S3N7_LYGHE